MGGFRIGFRIQDSGFKIEYSMIEYKIIEFSESRAR
jgi:hypothetical protein